MISVPERQMEVLSDIRVTCYGHIMVWMASKRMMIWMQLMSSLSAFVMTCFIIIVSRAAQKQRHTSLSPTGSFTILKL